MVFERLPECLAEDLLVAEENHLRTNGKHVRQHNNHEFQLLFLAVGFHHGEEIVLAAQHLAGVHAGDLADAEIVIGDMERLVIGEDHRINRAVVRSRGGEDVTAEIVKIKPCDARHALRHEAVFLRAGGGLEHNRIGNDCRGDQPCEAFRRHQSVLLIHRGDDRCG